LTFIRAAAKSLIDNVRPTKRNAVKRGPGGPVLLSRPPITIAVALEVAEFAPAVLVAVTTTLTVEPVSKLVSV